MDKRRDPTIAGPKERRTSGDILRDHVGGYNRGHTATFFELFDEFVEATTMSA